VPALVVELEYGSSFGALLVALASALCVWFGALFYESEKFLFGKAFAGIEVESIEV
jgi:hypothetical protein